MTRAEDFMVNDFMIRSIPIESLGEWIESIQANQICGELISQ
jgi:hypothetical protein